jgi:hypothetical protein
LNPSLLKHPIEKKACLTYTFLRLETMPEDKTEKLMQDETSQGLHDLHTVVNWGVGTLIPMTILFIVVGLISDSLTIFTVAMDYGLSVIVNGFAFVAIRIMLKKKYLHISLWCRETGKFHQSAIWCNAYPYWYFFNLSRHNSFY